MGHIGQCFLRIANWKKTRVTYKSAEIVWPIHTEILVIRPRRTELRQPHRHSAVDLIQDENHHQVDDDRRRRHRHAHVGLGLRVGAHGHQRRHCDAVDDDAENGREGQTKLWAKREMR